MLRPGGPGALARIFGMRTPRYRPRPYMLYAPNPEWRSADGKSRHKSLGFRGAEVKPTKPQGTLRIVCMGESSPYGSEIGRHRPRRYQSCVACGLGPSTDR